VLRGEEGHDGEDPQHVQAECRGPPSEVRLA